MCTINPNATTIIIEEIVIATKPIKERRWNKKKYSIKSKEVLKEEKKKRKQMGQIKNK